VVISAVYLAGNMRDHLNYWTANWLPW